MKPGKENDFAAISRVVISRSEIDLANVLAILEKDTTYRITGKTFLQWMDTYVKNESIYKGDSLYAKLIQKICAKGSK